MENRNVNLIPFNEFLMSNGKPDLAEIILNIIVFIPLGIYTGVLFKRWAFVNKLLFFFLVAFMFEALQFVFKIGAFDITDIVTNMSGGLTGLLIFEGIDKIFDNSSRSKKFINAVAAIGTIIMVSLLTLLKLNMLPLRYQ